MWSFTKKKLGDLLVESGIISLEQLNNALRMQKGSNKKLGQILIENNYVTKKNIQDVLERQLGIEYINLRLLTLEQDIVKKIPEGMARKYELIPIKLENSILSVAMSDPLNASALEDVRIFTGYEVQPVLSDSEQITGMISRYFSSQKAIEAVEEFSKANLASIEDDLTADIGSSPAVRLINILIEQAIQNNASDIHIEPQNKMVRIRYRIDGQLQDAMQSGIEILPSIVSRIKVMAGLNIAEKRLSQDGRISYSLGINEVDLRISILPVIYGEKVVIRVISRDTF